MKRLYSLLVILFTCVSVCMAQVERQMVEFGENGYFHGTVLPSASELKVKVSSDGKINIRLQYKGAEYGATEGTYDSPLIIFETYNAISETEERDALVEIYQALDGDNWVDKTNWCSDKPVSEWHGVYTRQVNGKNTVTDLMLYSNNLKGELPATAFEKLKNLSGLFLDGNAISGKIPTCLNKLTSFSLERNEADLEGPLPEHPWSDLMNYISNPQQFLISEYSDNWQVPEWAEKHERFRDYWLRFAAAPRNSPEQAYFDYWASKKIPMADFKLVDFNGGIHSNEDLAKSKLTIILEWEAWCPFSQALIKKLVPAYNQLHSKGLDILGVSSLCGMATPCVDEETHLKYIEKAGILWENCSETHENKIDAFRLYGGSPTLYAIDSDGVIIFQSFTRDYMEIIPFLEEYFGEKITGQAYYTSSDYSKDGEVVTLQEATEGTGIDLVFMGEGFVDKAMGAGGAYEQKMNEAMEQFFKVEPYKSLRNRFTVKAVKVVSPNAEFLSDAKHTINQSDEIAFKYAQNAVGTDADKAMVVVVYNVEASVGRSYTTLYYDDKGSFVAYCMDGVSTVLNHEVGGHGIAHLADEYVEPGNESLSLPTERKNELDEAHSSKGWYMNVDYNLGSQSVWKDYLTDSRYTSENIGSYEGAFLYGKGCYRPTENSMMRYNNAPFNAPSREAIYKRVMTLTDPSYKYSHEDFVEFDMATYKSASQAKGQGKTGESLGNINYTVKASIENPNRFSPKRFLPKSPVLKKGSWKDNL